MISQTSINLFYFFSIFIFIFISFFIFIFIFITIYFLFLFILFLFSDVWRSSNCGWHGQKESKLTERERKERKVEEIIDRSYLIPEMYWKDRYFWKHFFSQYKCFEIIIKTFFKKIFSIKSFLPFYILHQPNYISYYK